MRENKNNHTSQKLFEFLLENNLLKEWTTFKQIKTFFLDKGIKISQRDFAIKKDKVNELFFKNEYPSYIAHNTHKGYKSTTDNELIVSSIKDLKKRAYSMLKKASNTQKYLENRDTDSLL